MGGVSCQPPSLPFGMDLCRDGIEVGNEERGENP
jgi:hypothetical protein